MNSPSAKSKTSKSSIASSAAATAIVTRQSASTVSRAVDSKLQERQEVEAAAQPLPRSRTSSTSSCDSGSRSCGQSQSTSCSVPESEARWSDLPALKPLVNPHRLRALRLSSRDNNATNSQAVLQQNQRSWQEAVGGGDVTIVANQASSLSHVVQQISGSHNLEPCAGIDASSCNSAIAPSVTERNQCNNRRRYCSFECRDLLGNVADGDTNRSTSGSMLVYDECAATLTASASMPIQPIYQYSFRVPETRANMRAFCHASDRRVESIARACDSEILLDPQPIRTAAASVSLRRITIRAPDLHSLEKCCRMFDDKFPQFYASSGLGPGGRGVSKIYDDDNERYISASNDEMTFSSYS